MGTQHSLVRFYPAYGMSRDPQVRRAYYASLLQAPALISLALFAAVLLGLLAANGVHRVPHTAYLTVVLLLGEMRVLGSLAENTIDRFRRPVRQGAPVHALPDGPGGARVKPGKRD